MIHIESSRGEAKLVPTELRSQPVRLTVRRQEVDKPIIVEVRTKAKLQHISRIPGDLKYENFKISAQTTYVTLTGEPTDLWQLEKLFGSTYFDGFLAIAETYSLLELPVIPERDAFIPRLTLDLAIDGEVALTVREMLREHISTITGHNH